MRRHTLMFIDDEEVIRESFIKLTDWELHHYDVVGVYKNGASAWEYLNSHPVDIVVTDINMPFMDGITLLENLHQLKRHTRCIFLTGFEYFEYAHKAIQMQAFDFLLKPITKEKLFDAVERAALSIDQEEAVYRAVNQGRGLSQSTFINRLLYGKIENIYEEAENLGIHCGAGSYLLMMAMIDMRDGREIIEGELEEWKDSFKNKILFHKESMELALEKKIDLYFAKDIGRHLLLILISKERNLFSEANIRDFAEHLFEVQKECPQYRVTLVSGGSRAKIQELRESYDKVKSAAERRHTLRGNDWNLVFATDYTVKPQEEEKILLPTDILLQHIRMGMVTEVQEDIRKIYDSFRHQTYISLPSAKMVTTELALTAFKGETALDDNSVSYLYYLNHIQQLNTLEELESDITQFAVNIAKQRRKAGNPKKSMAEKAIGFLKENYSKVDLSLNDVAEYLNISIPYLAVLFKQETEQNFGMHLLTIRMEKAKELLRTTSCSVAEISERVGYSSAQYFAVKFKKYTGISPMAYRENR